MFPQSTNPSSLSKYYLFVVALTLTVLVITMLTAYNDQLLQLFAFGALYSVFLLAGFGVWCFKMYVFHQDDEPSVSRLILAGFAVTAGLFAASISVAITAKFSILNFMATGAILQLGHGILTPLSIVSTSSIAIILTFLMNICAPIAETAFFIVFLGSLMLGAFQVAGKVTPTSKALIVVIIATAGGFFHCYAYNFAWAQMVAAAVAFGLMSFYYIFVSASVLVTTTAHFAYNFIVLAMSLITVSSVSITLLFGWLTPYIALIPIFVLIGYHYKSL